MSEISTRPSGGQPLKVRKTSVSNSSTGSKNGFQTADTRGSILAMLRRVSRLRAVRRTVYGTGARNASARKPLPVPYSAGGPADDRILPRLPERSFGFCRQRSARKSVGACPANPLRLAMSDLTVAFSKELRRNMGWQMGTSKMAPVSIKWLIKARRIPCAYLAKTNSENISERVGRARFSWHQSC